MDDLFPGFQIFYLSMARLITDKLFISPSSMQSEMQCLHARHFLHQHKKLTMRTVIVFIIMLCFSIQGMAQSTLQRRHYLWSRRPENWRWCWWRQGWNTR